MSLLTMLFTEPHGMGPINYWRVVTRWSAKGEPIVLGTDRSDKV